MPLISLPILYKNISQDSVELYMQYRQEGELLKGKIEFPGGKIEEGETPQIAGSRELFEECGIKLDSKSLKLFKIYDVKGEKADVKLFCSLAPYEGQGNYGQWYQLKVDDPLLGIEDKIMPANHQIIRDVVQYLSELSLLTKIG